MATVSKDQPDVVLVGAGIMSATLAVFLKELDPSVKIELTKFWVVRHRKARMRGTMRGLATLRFVS
jgi:glycine/D-amino acid oxidase-like deaminating enzyme